MVMVLLAHDHPAVRAWIRAALVRAPDIEFVAEVSEGEEAWRLMRQISWDVALVACRLLSALSSVGVVERVEEVHSAVRVLVLGTPEHDELLFRLWRAGVVGCIPERAPVEVIVEALLAAASGRLLWTPEQVTRVQRWWDEIGSRLETLTAREKETLALMADGLSDRQIAQRLGVGKRTIQSHVSSILRKLGVETRQQAIVFVFKEMYTQSGLQMRNHMDDERSNR